MTQQQKVIDADKREASVRATTALVQKMIADYSVALVSTLSPYNSNLLCHQLGEHEQNEYAGAVMTFALRLTQCYLVACRGIERGIIPHEDEEEQQ